MLTVLVFDLDETIYPRDSGLMQAISQRINLYMIEKLGMDPETVSRLRREYWHTYGTTSRGLQLLHGIDVNDYMDFVHDVPLRDYIGANPDLDAVLASLPQRKVVFTNATAAHARAVLDVVGVRHHFEATYDAFFAGNESKPAPGSYRRLLDALNVDGEACLMVEDTARNLHPAKALGMVTVLLRGARRPTWMAAEADVDGVDYVIDHITDVGRVVREVDR